MTRFGLLKSEGHQLVSTFVVFPIDESPKDVNGVLMQGGSEVGSRTEARSALHSQLSPSVVLRIVDPKVVVQDRFLPLVDPLSSHHHQQPVLVVNGTVSSPDGRTRPNHVCFTDREGRRNCFSVPLALESHRVDLVGQLGSVLGAKLSPEGQYLWMKSSNGKAHPRREFPTNLSHLPPAELLQVQQPEIRETVFVLVDTPIKEDGFAVKDNTDVTLSRRRRIGLSNLPPGMAVGSKGEKKEFVGELG